MRERPDRREVTPSARGKLRAGPSFGPRRNVSVPISFGLPLMIVGLALVIAAARTDRTLFWALGGAGLLGGALLFATGRTL